MKKSLLFLGVLSGLAFADASFGGDIRHLFWSKERKEAHRKMEEKRRKRAADLKTRQLITNNLPPEPFKVPDIVKVDPKKINLNPPRSRNLVPQGSQR